MRFLLDTNILIPLEDSSHVLEESLANFVRIAHEHGHVLVYHPASEDDFKRDSNAERLKRNFERIKQYTRLDGRPPCPWNHSTISPNDAVDNEILFALSCEAAHILVSEDKGVHEKAKSRSLSDRVYTIQTAEDWLRRLHEKKNVQLPNIENVFLHELTPYLETDFFQSLREDYDFDNWFRDKARDGRKAWVYKQFGKLGAICIYTQQNDERITDEGMILHGSALKLCTFKVSEGMQGRKIGELFLKAAFLYASQNRLENIFIHGDRKKQYFLFNMLNDFGFIYVGTHPGSDGRDDVYCKSHPLTAPDAERLDAFEYARRYFPHFKRDSNIHKYIVPIQPKYHEVLFPDYMVSYQKQLNLFQTENSTGNAIKLAYLCHAKTKHINPGDIIFFYRSKDQRAITSIGVVEKYDTHTDADAIAREVKRRTVYSMTEIKEMAEKPTRVLLFRLIRHFNPPLQQSFLEENMFLNGAPQSITKISHDAFERIMDCGQ